MTDYEAYWLDRFPKPESVAGPVFCCLRALTLGGLDRSDPAVFPVRRGKR